MAPGISLLCVLLGASQSGVSLVRDDQLGLLARMLHTPLSPAALLLGKLLADVVRLLLTALVALALGAALGATFTPSWSQLPAALAAVVALAVLLCSLSCAFAALARAPEPMGAYVHLVNMPLLFTSTALVPGRQLPDWLAVAAPFNPLSAAVEGWRALWLGSGAAGLASLGALSAAALLAFALATWCLARLARQPGLG